MDRAALAWRLAGTLPLAERRLLALRLLETDADTITFRRRGVRWTAFPWDVIVSWPLFITGHFQGTELHALLKWLDRHRKPGGQSVIVDVGAHIGTSAIPLALATGCRVLALEPVAENHALLEANVQNNGLQDRITCVLTAVAMPGLDRVTLIRPATNSGGAEVARAGREPTFADWWPIRDRVEAPAAPLLAILEAHRIAPEDVALVWSDTQGCEADVIRSAPALWAAGVPLYAEVDTRALGGPAGIDAFLDAVAAHFEVFATAGALVTRGADARLRPVAELGAFCRSLGDGVADVLLVRTPGVPQ